MSEDKLESEYRKAIKLAWKKLEEDYNRLVDEAFFEFPNKGEEMPLQPEIQKTEEKTVSRETSLPGKRVTLEFLPGELESLPETGKIHGEPELRVPLRYLQKHAKDPYKSKRAVLCWVYDPGEPFQVVGDTGLVTNYEDHVFLTFGELSTAIILPRANLEKHFDPAKKSHKLTNITEGEEDGGVSDSGQKEQDDSGKGDEANVEDNLSGGSGCK